MLMSYLWLWIRWKEFELGRGMGHLSRWQLCKDSGVSGRAAGPIELQETGWALVGAPKAFEQLQPGIWGQLV